MSGAKYSAAAAEEDASSMSTSLEQVLPLPRLLEFNHVDLAATSHEVWERLRHGNLVSSPLVRWLFAIRTIPGRIRGEVAGAAQMRLDDLRSSAEQPGFQVLVDKPPHEVVVGAVGKVWRADIPFRHVSDAKAFCELSDPGWVKVAWALRVRPRGEHDARVELEVRVDATDEESWRKFRRYFTVVGPASRYIRRTLLKGLARRFGKSRPAGTARLAPEAEAFAVAERRHPRDDWHDVLEGVGGAAAMTLTFLTPFLSHARSHWGVDDATAARVWPGDDLVPVPRWGWTHGIEIDAPPHHVWPWVAQIGADRGGFYSYQWLENVAGCGVSNAEAIHTEWEISTGAAFVLHPKVPPLRVVDVVRGHYFVVHGAPDPAARRHGKPWVAASWLFWLEPVGERRSRFISRYRVATSDDLATRLQFGTTLVEPIGFAMDRRMLLGVKERAER